jgi:hypothetical protein
MTTPSDYITGTISLTNGSASFTGTATGWALAGFREGDTIIDITGATEYMGVIASITANGAGTLTKPWEGPTLTDVAYRMRYQPDGSRVTAQARQLIELLGNGNLQALAGLEGSANRIPMFIAPGVMQLVARTELTSGVNYDAQVDNIAARAEYDTRPGPTEERGGFAVLVSNTGDGRAAVYVKLSNASGDWSEPASVTGPAVTLDVGAVDALPFGSEPDVTLTSVPGGYEFDFQLPAPATFQSGTITTLDPGQSATFDLVPVTGGYALNLGVPRGPTGNISGVTSFWQNRITVDTTAAAARAGLGVDRLPQIPNGVSAGADFNELTTPGWHDRVVQGAQPNGYGGSTNGYLLVLAYSSARTQVVFPYREMDGPIRYRSLISGTWGAWRSVWDGINLPVGTQAEWNAGTVTEPRALRPDRLAAAIAALAPAVPADVYRRSNILAAVAQSAGVPTGGIIEYGSNANGQYIRLADGTQIAWCQTDVSSDAGGTAPVRFSTSLSCTFPASFASPPKVLNSAVRTSGSGIVWAASTAVSTTTTGASNLYVAFSVSGSAYCDVIAIGRWF